MNNGRLQRVKKKRHDEAYRAALEEIERRRKELQAAAPSEDSSPLEWLRHQDSLYEPLRQRRADRKAAMVDADVLRDWVRVSKIVSAVVKKEGARFDKKKRNKIKIEVCRNIVSDSADGRLGTGGGDLRAGRVNGL